MRRSFAGLAAAACLAAVFISGCESVSTPPPSTDVLGSVADFALTERSGQTVHRDDLKGKVWIAAFVFTCCNQSCPHISSNMERLQRDLAGNPDVVLVSFSVNPASDDPETLRAYADSYHADPDRWLFLTGKEDEVYHLIRDSFHLAVQQNEGAERTPGNEVMHSSKLTVVDRQGRIRGYYDGFREPRSGMTDADFEMNFRRLRARVVALTHEDEASPYTSVFPPLNATLNATSAFLILLGFAAVRSGRIRLHKATMLAAVAVSAVFLGCYLYYHIALKHGQPTRFEDQAPTAPDMMRTLYLAVLLSHTVLAIIVAPLVLFTVYQGLRDRIGRHVRVARWTLPIWIYVSLTGVVVYWMLYRLYPPP
jgi:protein SCO1/2/putative membrane protein